MDRISEIIEASWRGETLEALKAFVRLPSKNRVFDPDWEKNGWLVRAVEDAARWGRQRFPKGRFEMHYRPGLTPVLVVDLPAEGDHTGRPAFFYGHFDKQPETEGWAEGLGPWEPVVRDGRLYGRGSSDDGYSYYAALTAVAALDRAGIARPRVVGLFETNEESGSAGLAEYLQDAAPAMGEPAFLGILDLGVRDYERVWLTQSLRGVVSFELKVDVLDTPVHSGVAGGLVPSSFDVMRQLLDRLSDPATGRVLVPECWPEYPKDHDAAIGRLADLLGDSVLGEYTYAGGTQPRSSDPKEAILRTSWEPNLSFLAASGLPKPSEASALIRPSTALVLSFRIPPRVDTKRAFEAIRRTITTDVPSGARVTVSDVRCEDGFDAPKLDPWLRKSLDEASRIVFGRETMTLFEGASIGTLKDFAKTFPTSPFLNTGVLGAQENAHAPNESLSIDYVTKLTEVIARVVASIPQGGR